MKTVFEKTKDSCGEEKDTCMDLIEEKFQKNPSDDNYIRSLYQLASETIEKGEFNKARHLFQIIIKKKKCVHKSYSSGAYFKLGEIAYKNNDVKKARTYFMKCRKINPKHSQAQYYLNLQKDYVAKKNFVYNLFNI